MKPKVYTLASAETDLAWQRDNCLGRWNTPWRRYLKSWRDTPLSVIVITLAYLTIGLVCGFALGYVWREL